MPPVVNRPDVPREREFQAARTRLEVVSRDRAARRGSGRTEVTRGGLYHQRVQWNRTFTLNRHPSGSRSTAAGTRSKRRPQPRPGAAHDDSRRRSPTPWLGRAPRVACPFPRVALHSAGAAERPGRRLSGVAPGVSAVGGGRRGDTGSIVSGSGRAAGRSGVSHHDFDAVVPDRGDPAVPRRGTSETSHPALSSRPGPVIVMSPDRCQSGRWGRAARAGAAPQPERSRAFRPFRGVAQAVVAGRRRRCVAVAIGAGRPSSTRCRYGAGLVPRRSNPRATRFDPSQLDPIPHPRPPAGRRPNGESAPAGAEGKTREGPTNVPGRTTATTDRTLTRALTDQPVGPGPVFRP